MKLNIKTELLGTFGLMIALTALVFAVGFWGMSSVASHTTDIVTRDLVEDVLVRELEVLILEQTATYENFVITKNEEALATIEQETEAVLLHFEEVTEEFHGNVELLDLLHAVEGEYTVFLEAGDELVHLVHANADHEAIVHELELLEADEKLLEEELELLASKVEHNIEVAYDEALQSKSTATYIALGSLVVSIIAGFAVAYLVARSISSGVINVANSANVLATETFPALMSLTRDVAQGDLTKTSNFTVQKTDVFK